MKNKVVVMPVEKKPYDVDYLNKLRAQARASVEQIKQKPTIEEMYKAVDACWENKAFVHQTQFENKDQHYAYITEYYHSTIENLSLEQYKQLVLSDLLNRIDAAEALLSSDKIYAAAKEHKKQEDALKKQYQEQIDDLKKRNDDAMKDILKND